MDPRIAVVPGSFDPPTNGHCDVIARAARLYEKVHLVVVHNPHKKAMLSVEDRMALLQKSVDELGIDGDITIAQWADGLLVDYARDVNAGVLLKGIRSHADVDYETPMVLVNRNLSGIETVFLLSNPAYAQVSSSLVRQLADLQGDISPYVPSCVAIFLQAHTRS